MTKISPKTNDITDFFGEVISKYTSDQAEQDGILVKTDNPIINYITHTVLNRCIEPFIESFAMTTKINAGKDAFVGAVLTLTETEKNRARTTLIKKLLDTAITQIKAQNREDWLYTLKDCRGWELWVAQNETGKFTLMFPEDY